MIDNVKALILGMLMLGALVACEPNTKQQKKEINEPTQTSIKKINFDEFKSRLEQKNDTIYVYNFWATWCKPCIAELPYFEQLNQQYAKQKVKVVLVSLDFPSIINTKLVPFVEKQQLKSEVLVLDAGNPNEWIDKISENWTGAIPASLFVYNPINYYELFEQTFTYETLCEVIDPIIAHKKTP